MNLRQLSFIFSMFSLAFLSCAAEKTTSKKAVFTHFTYQGNDEVYKNNPLLPDEFYTPILQGC
ncbi:MAG: hypothetical protein LBT78_10145, partial [Tannerella sp.]|nr:hypothetical protein [Tannerella sp.]